MRAAVPDGRVDLVGVVQLDDLDRLVEAGGLGGERHHQHRAEGEVRGDEHADLGRAGGLRRAAPPAAPRTSRWCRRRRARPARRSGRRWRATRPARRTRRRRRRHRGRPARRRRRTGRPARGRRPPRRRRTRSRPSGHRRRSRPPSSHSCRHCSHRGWSGRVRPPGSGRPRTTTAAVVHLLFIFVHPSVTLGESRTTPRGGSDQEAGPHHDPHRAVPALGPRHHRRRPRAHGDALERTAHRARAAPPERTGAAAPDEGPHPLGDAGPRRSGGCHSGVGGRALGLRALATTAVAATTAVPRATLAALLALTVTGGGVALVGVGVGRVDVRCRGGGRGRVRRGGVLVTGLALGAAPRRG